VGGMFREVHLLLLHLKDLTELLDAGLGAAHAIHPLGEKQKKKIVKKQHLTLNCLFSTLRAL